MASIYQQFNFPSNETLNNNNQLLQDQVLSSDKVVKNLTAQFLQDDQKQLQPLDENLKKKIDGKNRMVVVQYILQMILNQFQII